MLAAPHLVIAGCCEFPPHALHADNEPLTMRLNAARQKRFTLGFLAYGAKAELRMPPTETTHHVNLTMASATFAERDDGARAVTEARASGVVLLPDRLNTVRWTPDAEQLILKIPRTRLESHLSDLTRRPVPGPIDFRFDFSTTTPRGRSCLRPWSSWPGSWTGSTASSRRRWPANSSRLSSRFARQYQERFSELPSDTARRCDTA